METNRHNDCRLTSLDTLQYIQYITIFLIISFRQGPPFYLKMYKTLHVNLGEHPHPHQQHHHHQELQRKNYSLSNQRRRERQEAARIKAATNNKGKKDAESEEAAIDPTEKVSNKENIIEEADKQSQCSFQRR